MNVDTDNTYHLLDRTSQEGLRYFFVSKGKTDIVKVVDYSKVDFQSDVIKTDSIFNFGFADFNLMTGEVKDEVVSGNGDGRKVMYTALSTIPMFFDKYPKEAIMISGSDSKDDFHERCFPECKKRCKEADVCKNKHQRINVYRLYLNQKLDEYSKEYTFFGGVDDTIEPYEKGKDYKLVFVIKK